MIDILLINLNFGEQTRSLDCAFFERTANVYKKVVSLVSMVFLLECWEPNVKVVTPPILANRLRLTFPERHENRTDFKL